MTLRSMTAFAQARGDAHATADAAAAEFTLSLKSVNHRFLDLHFRRPSESEALEMKLRQLLNEKLARGHVDVSLNFEAAASAAALKRELVRSDVQEEVVRMKAHVEHFLGLIKTGGETGKKLDFLLQEMNREANTMLSKTAGIAGHGLRVTELGLAMKAEIEKAREQVQNVE